MLVADRALMGAQQPAFQQRDRLVHPRQQLRRLFAPAQQKDDAMLVTLLRERLVAQPAVGVDRAAGLSTDCSTKGTRLTADASRTRRMRMRPIATPFSSTATAIKALRSVCRPERPSSELPQ